VEVGVAGGIRGEEVKKKRRGGDDFKRDMWEVEDG